FLDYYATSSLDVDVAQTVIEGIARGCELAKCALLGGETAEMPGLYHDGDYDLAGFCVGVVERERLIDNTSVSEGDRIIGLPSSGPHSNGYSLIRKVLAHSSDSLSTVFDGRALSDWLLEPTRIYVASVLAVLQEHPVNAMAHITGGGLSENIPRVLPSSLCAQLDTTSWSMPAIFDWIADQGGVTPTEMRRTFNCGIGFTLIVPPNAVEDTCATLREHGEAPRVIGTVQARQDGEPVTFV
ncbi:MAG: phosphoribosylformylglycinamidine cyclo-ligase, partial [Pseudomonadota bacterium]